MRIVVHGQQAFGKAVLEALLKRGENVVGVYVAPEKPGQKADPLKEAALAAKLPVFQPASYRKPEVLGRVQGAEARPAGHGLRDPVRARGVPQHPDARLDPVSSRRCCRPIAAPSAINWPIILGEKETGLSIFWPDNGLDTGDVLLQKKTPIGPKDTLGTVYFDRLFPMGVEAMLEVGRPGEGRQGAAHQAGRVARPPTKAAPRPTSPASTGASRGARSIRWCAAAIRRPAPGRRSTARTCRSSTSSPCPPRDPKGIGGKYGEVVEVDADGFTVVCPDGRIKVTAREARRRPEGRRRRMGRGSQLAVGHAVRPER